MLPLLGHSSPHRSRARVVLLAAASLLVALTLIAASTSGAPSPSISPVVLRSTHGAASVTSEDRFVSQQDAYVKSMNGHGGLSVFDPRCLTAALLHSSALASPLVCISLTLRRSLSDDQEHVIPLDVNAPSGAPGDDRVIKVSCSAHLWRSFLTFLHIVLILPLPLPLLQLRVPLGVDLRTAPLHGTDDVLPEPEFGQVTPYVPRASFKGIFKSGVFSGISNIFADQQQDPHHKHYP